MRFCFDRLGLLGSFVEIREENSILNITDGAALYSTYRALAVMTQPTEFT
jgi:hypothetical protein